MAAAVSNFVGQSPPAFTRTLERIFDDAQNSGEINLSGRKLKEYPKVSSKYDLNDSSTVDLSRNRLLDIPEEICEYRSLQRLNCYYNVLRTLPPGLVELQTLVYLNLSRNQLSTLPPFMCQLFSLEVLLVSNNKLVSLPEEIGQLARLMQLDVSCNEISHLPSQIGDLGHLRHLNLRKNLLVELPTELARLSLTHLDCSCNRLTHLSTEFRTMFTLQEVILEGNPLQLPPAYICNKGRVHIFKFLEREALNEDRKREMLSEIDSHENGCETRPFLTNIWPINRGPSPSSTPDKPPVISPPRNSNLYDKQPPSINPGMGISPTNIKIISTNVSFSSQLSSSSSSDSALPARTRLALDKISQELNVLTPGFTMRRQLKHAQEEMEQIERLRQNIESRLKVTLPDDLPATLKDGVVLCHLVNSLRPRVVSSIHVPSPSVPKLSIAKCRRNVENFLDACRKLGVGERQLCPVSSILEEKGAGLLQVAITVDALLARFKPIQNI